MSSHHSLKSLKSLKSVLQVNPNHVRVNGKDHIFLNPFTGPQPARILSLEWNSALIRYPTLGKFNSVKNLWFWMTTEGHPDVLRTLKSREINGIQKLTVSATDRTPLYRKGPNVDNFRAIIMVGKYLQLRRMVDFPFLEDGQEELPWMIYKTERDGGLKSLSRYSEWYCKAAKSVYNLIREERTTKGPASKVDSILNGKLHKAAVDNGFLDNPYAVYPYTADLLSTIVMSVPVDEDEHNEQPVKEEPNNVGETLSTKHPVLLVPPVEEDDRSGGPGPDNVAESVDAKTTESSGV
jgi:hypothetical protein